MRLWAAVGACLLVCGSGALVGAQQLHGTVRDSASRQPIPGAVLMLLDTSGAVLGRNITNERGEYRVVLASRMRRVRVVRIGFRPRETPIPAVVGGAAELDLVMRALPTMLEQVRVSAGPQCPRRSDEATTFALLEQVRAGLLAIVVAREANPASLVRLTFVRTMDGGGNRITSQRVHIDLASRAAVSFNAAHTATDFVRRGFMADSEHQEIFYAPDADVLLDQGFAAGYCFRIVSSGRERPNQIGLGFAAADRQRDRVDIDGVLWVDTLARALRDIEHRYVGLDHQIEAMRPGGQVSFREMPNGVVMIDRWSLRLIGTTVDSVRTPATLTLGGQLQPPAVQLRTSFHATETGGEVARAAWTDGTSWRAALGTLRLRALTSDHRPAGGTAVHLAGTDYRTVADSSGNIEISNLLPGPYSIAVTDPRLAPLEFEIATTIKFVAERDSTVRDSLVVGTPEEFVIKRCIADRRYSVRDSVLLLGRALTAEGLPSPGSRSHWSGQTARCNRRCRTHIRRRATASFSSAGKGFAPG